MLNNLTGQMALYRGVVEDNNDPIKLGRVRVRIFGIHSAANEHAGKKFELVKTSELPWAEVSGGTGFGLVGGVGLTSVLKQGTWVWVVLENNDPNKPIVFGTISGVNSNSSKKKASAGHGFYDPSEVYPFVQRSSETDLNRLARAEKLGDAYYDTPTVIYTATDDVLSTENLNTTIHDKINQTLNEVTETDDKSGAAPTFKEPESLSDKAVYPNSQVFETQSGHVIEIDDTESNERIRLYHKSGSYFEVRPDGSFVQKSVGSEGNYYIHAADVNEHITASVKRYVKDNLDEIIKGYVHRHIEGELKEHIVGLVDRHIESTLKEHVVGDITLDSDGNVTWTVGGNFTLNVTGKIDIDAGPEIDMDAGIINLN